MPFNFILFFLYNNSNDLCEKKLNFPMCPQCDEKCEYTSLTDSCQFAKVSMHTPFNYFHNIP